ncbi:WD repeat-containing protein 87-like [Saccopteryx bilineata]|uniref:WD repeat-containing protein 87-like n=1 Tax=Saccopteryx bilineata TaxID=59482 RepID=UPI00338D94CE
MSASPRLIPEWKDLKILINNVLKDVKVVGKPRNDVVILSDWPETLYQELYHPKNKPFICFYSTNVNYFVSLNWMEPYSKQMQAVLWIQRKDAEMKGMIEKMKFHLTDQVPPIKAMVHTGSYHMLIAYCGDMHLWLFGDHHQAFTFLGTVHCHFSISCLCYDPKTELLLSGTLGAVVTWFILPNGRGLQMAQTVSMPGHELVQGFSLSGPQDSLLALSENTVRVFTLQGEGQLIEVKKFTPIASGSPITCSFTCVSQGYLYAGNRDGEVHAWGLARGNFLHRFQAHSSSVICIHSRPETYTLLTAGSEGVVREWNLAFGNLLRQLDIDEELQQLQFIDNTTFFCQTTHTFSLYSLPYFYTLFNVCGSAPQQVQRVCCGRNWTRILCATKDGLLRFLSPVTGDLLVITWPLLVVDKAVTWAYDSDREELFVATKSSEVLVFDTTRSPCTAKYLVCTSVNPEDRVRCLAYGQSHLGKGLVGLMFCGHESGIVRILSHYTCARTEKTVHLGAVLALSTLEGPQENSLLCSYGIDNIVQLTEAVLQENKVILQPVSKIFCSCVLKHVILLPGSVGAITENHCWCLWHYQDFPTSSKSKQSSKFKETKCLHHCAITSFDVCLSLKLFVTRGTDGSVRIWTFHGRLITELDSSLHFGPLCFANNRGDLLLTFNQSLYLVSCLKLLPLAQLIHLAILNNADEIHEVPRPFLPSFFFSFEIVFVPKFVYLGQGLQELQGLEALVNKRVIAFDNTVPHVVEEERRISSVTEKEPKLHFLEDKDIYSSTLDPKHNRPSHLIPAQLRLAGWDGLNPYHILRCFFGHGQQWPFAPDGYIPNSVVRARLWPEGTPVFLLRDLYPPYRDKDWDETDLFRGQALSPMSPVKEQISKSKEDKSREWKQTLFDILAHLTNLNWIGRKLDERLIHNLIEAILNLTVYCSVEQYKIYVSALAQIFATCQVSSSLCSETACRLLEDTTHSDPQIRKLAWEGLERLNFMSPLFAVPLAAGLMDKDKNVRAKALYLMLRVTGIQTKTMLVSLLKKQETFQNMQEEFIGDTSLDQLLGIRANDLQYLLRQVEQQLNENLMLSHTPLSKPGKITEVKKRMTHVQAKSRKIIKKDLRVSKMEEQTEFVDFSSVLMPSKDEGEQRESRISEQIDIQDVTLEPELPLRTFSPVEYQEGAESKETMLDATEALDVTEAVEVTKFMKAIDQYGMKDYEKVIPKLEILKYIKLWKGAMKKTREKVNVKLKEKKDMKDISKTTAEEPMEEVIMIAEQKTDTEKKLEKRGHGLAGTPGRIGRADIRNWRIDICSLVTSRIASFHPEMIRDLGQELVDLAQAVLTPRHPSWDIFQEICPLLKGSSELYHEVVEEPLVVTEKMKEEDFKEEETVGLRKQGRKVLKKGKAFSQVKKKKIPFLESHRVLEKNKFKNEVRKLARQEGKIAEEEEKLSKPKKKLIQEKEKLTKDKLTHQTEKTAWEGEILASSQKKLTRGEQKLVLGEKKQTGKEGKPLGERKGVTWKEKKAIPGRRKWDWEETLLAQEEGMWTQEEGFPIWKDRKLSQAEEKAEEEELGEEEEELAWDEEELVLDIENRERERKPYEKKKHVLGMEKHVEEEAWERGKLAQKKEHLFRKQEGLSGEAGEWALKGSILVQRVIKLTQERKKRLEKEKKEADKKKQIQERKRQVGKQEKEDQKERQAKKDEKEAKGKQLVSERKKPGLGEEKFGEAKILSQEDKQAAPKAEKAWEKERKAQKQEITTKKKSQQSWGKKKGDLREEEQAGEMGKWLQKEKEQAWGKKGQDQREEIPAGKVEKEPEEDKRWTTEKMKLVPEEKKIKEIGKVSSKEEKQVMKKEAEAKKEEKWVRRGKKATEEKEHWTRERGQRAPQEGKQALKERTWGQKGEKDSEQKEQWAWEKEKLSLEEREQASEMKKKSQEKEERALEERLTKKDSQVAREERRIPKKEKEMTREGIGIDKRRKDVTEGEKEMMKKEGKLFQEERQLTYDRTTEMGVAERKKERTGGERIQAMRKLDMGRGIRSEEQDAGFREKDLRKKVRHLLRILAKTMRRISMVPLEEIKIVEEERPSIIERSEIDGQKREIFKEQKEITKEQLDQKERKVEEERLTDEESLEEDRRLLEKVQETILDKIQVESILKEIQEENLLGKMQLKKLLKRIENKAEETPVKWLLENIRDILFESFSESLTEKEIEEEPTRKGKEESSGEKEVEDEEMDKIKKEEEEEEEEEKAKEEKQKDEANLNKEKEKEGIFKETELSREDRVLKTELSVEGVSYLKLVKEDEILEEEREGTARREVPFKKERWLHGKRDPTFMDEPIWPTVLKSPFKTLLPAALEKKEGMALKILGDQLDLEGQQSQLGAYPMTSSQGRQEDVHLEKSRDMFLQTIETGLETRSPKGLHGPGSHFPIIIKPQKPERRPKGGRWKWSLKYRDSSVGRTEGQAPAPAPVAAPAPAPSLASMPAERPYYSEASFSDEDWVNNALIRLEAGEPLSRDSFHKLSQLLRDFTSKGYLKWMHLSNLKAIAKHFRQNLEMSHTATLQPCKDILRPLHLKVIPPIRRKEKDNWLEPFLIPEPKPLPIPAPGLPSITKRIQVPMAINWHLLGEPYRSVRVRELFSALKEMEIRHFYPVSRDIFTGAHASVDKQTLALLFQKDLRAFQDKGRLPKLPQLKKAKPNSKKKEEVPLWETFVALYHVLRMLQERYAEDSATWMKQFYQLMDLYQLKSPRIQRLLLELLQRKQLQPQETIYKKALETKELVLGERLFYGLFCGSSHAPAGSLKFQDVVPLPGKNKVHTIQPVGIAQYGFLELAWKSLPQVNPYLIERLPNITTPTL